MVEASAILKSEQGETVKKKMVKASQARRVQSVKLQTVDTTLRKEKALLAAKGALNVSAPKKEEALKASTPRVVASTPTKEKAVDASTPKKEKAVDASTPKKEKALNASTPKKEKAVVASTPQKEKAVVAAAPQKEQTLVDETKRLKESSTKSSVMLKLKEGPPRKEVNPIRKTPTLVTKSADLKAFKSVTPLPASTTSSCTMSNSVAKPAKPQKSAAEKIADMETEVIANMSWVRQYPNEAAALLTKKLMNFRGKNYILGPNSTLVTHEGASAVEEAIRVMNNMRPLAKFQYTNEPGLRLAAEDHVADIGPRGKCSHDGSDGSKPRDRVNRYGRVRNRSGENLWFGELSDAMDIVFDLIVDDGVPGRGHRKVIFSPEYYVVGCRIKPHASYGHVCALSFVDGFSGDDTRMKKRMKDGPPVRGEFF